MNRHVRLGINIDHVATLRNARGGDTPKVTEAAKVVEESGADLITVHVREDRRHINEKDLGDILDTVNIPVNLEIAANSEMIDIAINYHPKFVCFVPENRKEITTEGGLDVINNFKELNKVLKSITDTEINVSIFIDPDKEQIKAVNDLGISTVEFHTGSYANAFIKNRNIDKEFKKIEENVFFAKEKGINCHAGHGLTFENVAKIAGLPDIIELNIGHFIIADSIFNGLQNSILKMRNIITKASI